MKKSLKTVIVSTLALTGALNLTSCSSKGLIGVILVGDETEGYTKAHMDGIEAARKKLNISKSKVMYKKSVHEDNTCATAAEDLVSEGCKLIISNSYGHQDYMASVAKDHSDITFVASTGDYAAVSKISNYKNSFTNVYEARYVSGVVGGMKLKELIDSNKLTESNKDKDGNYLIGYVGAFTYAEVVSGYTAFYLGVKSVVPNVAMQVQFTGSWFDIDEEANAAGVLANNGCVIIGQHADSTGAPSKCEELRGQGKEVYSVGYNIDMLSVAPNAALTSATNNWEVYYEYAFQQILDGNEIATDWAKGYDAGAVGITELGSKCAAGTKEKVDEIEAKLKNGTFHVFDTSTFTVNGSELTEYNVDLSYRDWSNGGKVIYQGETVNAIKTDGTTKYFSESTYRSAPYFDVHIDGITWLNRTM